MRGACLGRSLACCLLLLGLHCFLSEAGRVIAGDDYVYEVKQGDEVCLYASFRLVFTVSYINQSNDSIILSTALSVPTKDKVSVSGSCSHNISVLHLEWSNNTDFSATLIFATAGKNWHLEDMMFTFDTNNSGLFPDFMEREVQTISTGGEKWFNRTFNTDQYYYCKSCKMRRFANCSSESGNNCSACAMATKEQPDGKNKTVTECSEVEMEKSVIFLGDFNKTHPSKRLCLEDYIALQEIIVPIVVGGVLALLLVLISVAYVIAYIRRKAKERKTAQYEPVGGDY